MMTSRPFDPVRLVILALILTGSGCAEEWNPERPETTTVQGSVKVGNTPVSGGYLQFDPVDGTAGNLRVAPIGRDGTFQVDRVPVGRVVVGLDQLPLNAIPGPGGPVSPRVFQSFRSPIRRTIPGQPVTGLTVDLIDEVSRMGVGKRAGRRRKNRSGRKSRKLTTPSRDPVDPAHPRHEPRVQVIYREGSGALHLDWPSDRVAEAVADTLGMVWVDIEDLEAANNSSVEAMLRDIFQFHPLAIEDALQDTHVPKLDDWGRYLYLVVNTIDFDPETDDLRLHELDLFLGPNYLLTYHNEATEVLDRHRRNLVREPENRLKHGADHLLYRILDDVVSDFLPAINHLDDAIDDAQDEVFATPTPRTLQKIFQVKRSALRIHRIVIPMREVLTRLTRDAIEQVEPEHRIYFRDVYDHMVRIHDVVESLRDLIGGALDTYLSVVSNRTNEIMKALTLVNVMFLPMTFLVGFFGMNFFGETLMFTSPKLPNTGLFWLVCTLMLATPVIMGWIAWHRGWFGSTSDDPDMGQP